MSRVVLVLRELVGLVDDYVGFAATVVAWIALVWFLSSYVSAKSALLPVVFFARLGAILLFVVARRARASR